MFKRQISTLYFNHTKKTNFIEKLTKNRDDLKKTILFNFLINSPFYILSAILNLNLTSINEIDLSRLTLRSLSYSQCILSGINISNSLNKYQLDITKENQIDLKKNICKSLLPCIISFINIQILLNVETTIMLLNLSLPNLLIQQIYTYHMMKKLNSNNLNSHLITLILNSIFLLIFFNYLRRKKNPLERINDNNRIENLYDIEDLKQKELLLIEQENSFFLENLDEQDLDKISEMLIKDK